MRGRVPVLAVLTASLLLAGCAKSKDDNGATRYETPAPTTTPDGGKADGTYKGDFHLVDNPPEGTDKVTGTAEMEVGDGGTKVTVSVDGLQAKAAYVAFVYDDACAAATPGGARYVIDPDASDDKKNVQLKIEVKDGKGTAEAKNDKQATTGARSVIVHLARAADAKKDEKDPPKIACADLVKA